jgi:hypothetical protein
MTSLVPIEIGKSIGIQVRNYSVCEYKIDKVSRLTKTQIILDSGLKFRLDNQTHICKQEKWKTNYYYLCEIDESFKDKVFRQNALAKIKELKFNTFSSDQLRDVLKILLGKEND